MKKFFGISVLTLLTLAFTVPTHAQEPNKDAKPPIEMKGSDAKPADAPKEETWASDHTTRIGGQSIAYKATASLTMLKDDKGEPTALIFSTAYTRTDLKDTSPRPIAFVYNGGPGSASIWLHMGAFGPRRVVTTDAAATAPAPYKLEDNANSLLDKTDLVFIDPVGTGFSRAVGKSKTKISGASIRTSKSLAQFIDTYVNRNNRWNSPKFLIGESYGTFRSAALGNYLQTHDGMYINGIVLISSVAQSRHHFLHSRRRYALRPLSSQLRRRPPTTNKALKEPPADLAAFLAEARQFASTEYTAALMKGANITARRKSGHRQKALALHRPQRRLPHQSRSARQPPPIHGRTQRTTGLTTGRYDSRYTMPTYDLLTENAEDDPSYHRRPRRLRRRLQQLRARRTKSRSGTHLQALSGEVGGSWDWKHNRRRRFFPGPPNVEGDLINALMVNPHLHVQVENGFFDMATPFFATEYTMDHLFLPAHLRDNIDLKYYNAGHMMYLHQEDLTKLKSNIAAFIDANTKQ